MRILKILFTDDSIDEEAVAYVEGSADFEYFIAKYQYEKWKKTYRMIKSIILLMGLLIDAFLIYLFLPFRNCVVHENRYN